VRASVAARRDPLEVVAVNVPNVAAAEKYYADTFGMTGSKPLDSNGQGLGFTFVHFSAHPESCLSLKSPDVSHNKWLR